MQFSKLGRDIAVPVKNIVKSCLGRRFPDLIGARRYQKVAEKYEPNGIIENNGLIPVTWWDNTDNFGDLLPGAK